MAILVGSTAVQQAAEQLWRHKTDWPVALGFGFAVMFPVRMGSNSHCQGNVGRAFELLYYVQAQSII